MLATAMSILVLCSPPTTESLLAGDISNLQLTFFSEGGPKDVIVQIAPSNVPKIQEMFKGLVREPSPPAWPVFGRVNFVREKRKHEFDLYSVEGDEIAVSIDRHNYYRGLSKKTLLTLLESKK